MVDLGRLAAWLVAVGIVLLLSACGPQPDETPTPAPRESVGVENQERAEDAVAAFLEAMADPEVTYRASGQLRVGREDEDGRPDILVNTRYDVLGDEFGGSFDIHLRDPTVGGGFSLAVLGNTAHMSSAFPDEPSSMDTPPSLRRPDALRELTDDDLELLGVTDGGLFEFQVTPWLGGDPLGQWVALGALPEGALPFTELQSHDTRLLIDDAGVPHRLITTWSFTEVGESDIARGTIVEEIVGLGMYVRLQPPGGFPGWTSHDVIVGVGGERFATEPWVDVAPADGATAVLDVVFPPPDQPVMLGIEGAIGFVRSHDVGGKLILDQIVDLDADSVQIPAGRQTLVAYYRSCSGSCGLLDPPHEFCSVELDAIEGARYELTVQLLARGRAACTFEGPEGG